MKRKNFNKKNSFQNGFTMIETMIAITVFLVVIIYGTTSLLNAYSVNRKSQDLRSILDSLSFTLEDMSRNIRTGYSYQCFRKGESPLENLEEPVDCSQGYGIAFESSDGEVGETGDQWVYYFSEGKLFKSTSSLTSILQMTPDTVLIDVENSNILVIGAKPGDNQQPLVTINLVGTVDSKGIIIPFTLQTTVSQRVNDI